MSSLLIRQDLGPMVVGYLLVMGALALGLRIVRRSGTGPGPGPAPGPGRARRELSTRITPRPGWARLITHLAITAAGGYLLLMIVVIGYYYGVARVGGQFLESAFTGCALLLGFSAPLFLAASWLAERWRRRSQRPRAGPVSAGGSGRPRP
jgi:hypothetical protein